LNHLRRGRNQLQRVDAFGVYLGHQPLRDVQDLLAVAVIDGSEFRAAAQRQLRQPLAVGVNCPKLEHHIAPIGREHDFFAVGRPVGATVVVVVFGEHQRLPVGLNHHQVAARIVVEAYAGNPVSGVGLDGAQV
jgi:hypothetical protein